MVTPVIFFGAGGVMQVSGLGVNIFEGLLDGS